MICDRISKLRCSSLPTGAICEQKFREGQGRRRCLRKRKLQLLPLHFASSSRRAKAGAFAYGGDLPAHKLFNRGQRSCDAGCQLLAAIEGVTSDRDQERTRTDLVYGLCVTQQAHRRQMMPERRRRSRVRIDGLTLPASWLADERCIDENHE